MKTILFVSAFAVLLTAAAWAGRPGFAGKSAGSGGKGGVPENFIGAGSEARPEAGGSGALQVGGADHRGPRGAGKPRGVGREKGSERAAAAREGKGRPQDAGRERGLRRAIESIEGNPGKGRGKEEALFRLRAKLGEHKDVPGKEIRGGAEENGRSDSGKDRTTRLGIARIQPQDTGETVGKGAASGAEPARVQRVKHWDGNLRISTK